MMDVLIILTSVLEIWSFLLKETVGQTLSLPVALHTTHELPCKYPVRDERILAAYWYKSSQSDQFVKGEEAVAWWFYGDTGSSQGYNITDSFALVMHNVNITNRGLYRCEVTPSGNVDDYTHDVNIKVYAKPDRSPVIKYIRLTNGFNVTCSISNVFPMTYPMLTSTEGNGTAYINRYTTNNRDGIFNTTVTCLFSPNEKHTTIECLYSNFNFESMSSLLIVDSDTVDQNTTHNTDNTYCRPKPSGLWMVWIILITEVLFSCVIVYAIKTGRVRFDPAPRKTIRNNTDDIDRDEHHGENSKEEEPAKSTRILVFGKLSCAVITFTIPIIIVLILLVAYLATARCLTEAGGNKNEMFQQSN